MDQTLTLQTLANTIKHICPDSKDLVNKLKELDSVQNKDTIENALCTVNEIDKMVNDAKLPKEISDAAKYILSLIVANQAETECALNTVLNTQMKSKEYKRAFEESQRNYKDIHDKLTNLQKQYKLELEPKKEVTFNLNQITVHSSRLSKEDRQRLLRGDLGYIGQENTRLKIEDVKNKTGAKLNGVTHAYGKTVGQTNEPNNLIIKKGKNTSTAS